MRCVHTPGSCISGQDPCQTGNHEILNDPNGVRGSGISGSNIVCDAIISEGWYRVTSPLGGDIPTTCLPEGSCSTQYPVWLDGRDFIKYY